MKKSLIGILVLIFLYFSGCAKNASSIEATYVSPIEYSDLSCKQLKEEALKVKQTLIILSKQQNESAEKENTFAMAMLMVGLISIDVGGAQEAKIGRLKGRYKTIKDVAEKKNCSFTSSMD